MAFAGMFPELNAYLTSNLDFEFPTETQDGNVTCHDCWLKEKVCDLTPLNQPTNSTVGCAECTEAGVICHIPVSDTALIQQGFNTAIDGRRKCLTCAMTERQCIFPLGQRPNPCLSCVKEGRVSCRIIPPIPTAEMKLLEYPVTPACSITNEMSIQPFNTMLPGQQTTFPHVEASVQDFGGIAMLHGEQQNDHLFDPTPDTGLSLGTNDPEYAWLTAGSEFSQTPKLVDLTGTLEQSDCAAAVADTPHSSDPSMDFSVGLALEATSVSETASSQEVQQDAGFLGQDVQMALSGKYRYYDDETDLTLSQDMFSPNVW